jgi:fructose-1,6-bisphosphatase/inositol monophosphatase family enzyme
MVAFVRDDRVAAGWIHDPIKKRTAVAEHGGGAWLDGDRLHVAAGAEAADMSGVLLAGYFGDPTLGRRVQQRRHRVRAEKSLRCAGLEYVRLARGDMHFGLFTKLMPWDHAAGVLIHAEAGGHSAYLEGGGFDPARVDASGLLLAPDPTSWRTLRQTLLGDPDIGG